VSFAASGDGLKVPVIISPLAWAGRTPGWTPPDSLSRTSSRSVVSADDMTRSSGWVVTQSRNSRSRLPHGVNGLAGRQDRLGQDAVIDERRLVAVADFGVTQRGRRVLHHGDLEALFEQFAQVALDAQVGQHPRQ